MMAGRGLKRGGCEKMNMESEEESLVKHQKLSEDMKKNPDEADEMSDDDFVDLSEDISNLPEADKENVMEDPSPPEAVEENVMKDPSLQGHHEGFVPVEPTKSEAAEGNVMEDSSPPGHHEGFVPVEPTKSEADEENVMADPSPAEAAEENVMEDPSPLGDNEDLVLVEATMSDDWIFVIYKKSASELWVVTKSPYSCAWIKDVLESNVFNEYKSDGKTLKFQIDLNEKFKMKLSSCSCVVFYFENDKWDSATAEEVKELSDSYAMKNVIILLSENTSNNPLPGPMRVLNFSKQEVAWYKDNLKFYNSKIEAMKTLVKDSTSRQGHKVGIFSRSSESDFEWLKILLESEYFCDAVKDVRPYYISNRGFQQFMTDVSNCSFGILYHTKNRGRINITDVTDSLYDEELDYMSGMLNKKVIVVVDDLQNGSDEEKSRIQQNQRSIMEKALDLLLFTTEEKKFLKPLVKMRSLINGENK